MGWSSAIATLALGLSLAACGSGDGGSDRRDAGPGGDAGVGTDCVPSGFCAESPFGEPIDYHAIWGAADDAVWVAGSRGAARFFDGATWSSRDPGESGDLNAIDGSGPGDVWAVGDAGAIWRWDGGSWSRIDAGTAADLNGVSVVGPQEVYVTGDGGVLLRYDGAGWTDVGPETESPLSFVDALGSDRVITTNGVAIFEWDGASWTETVPPPGAGILGLHAVDADTALVLRSGLGGYLVEQLEAGAFTFVANGGANARAMFVDSAGELVLAGTLGFIHRGDLDIEHGRHTMRGVWRDSTGGVWAAGEYGTLMRLEPAAEKARVIDAGDQHTMLAVYARSATDVWMVGLAGKIVHFDGSSFARVDSGTGADLHAVTAAAGGTIWAAGDGGAVIELAPAGPIARDLGIDAALRAVVSDGGGGVWVAGGVLQHWEGSGWSEVATLVRFANAAWSPVPGELWIAQSQRSVRRYVDDVEVEVESPAGDDFFAIWGASASDVLVGAHGHEVYRYDGAEWSEEATPPETRPIRINALWGSAAGDVFALGDRVLHHDGATWSETAIPGNDLRGVHGAGGEAWLVGWEQTFWRRAAP